MNLTGQGVVGDVCGPVGTAAAVHFGIATPNVKILEHFNDFADSGVSDLVDCAPRVDETDGCFAASDRPGLGLTLNREACARMPRSRAFFDLFAPGWERRDAAQPASASKELV